MFFFTVRKKIVLMYAGAPKFAQDLFFWNYHLTQGLSQGLSQGLTQGLRVRSSIKENILLLNNIGIYNYTEVVGLHK